MREIHDAALLRHYLALYQIESFFDTRNLPFRLYEYDPGELMNVAHPSDKFFKFVVAGSFDHYAIQEDGTKFMIYHCEGFGCLGGLDFCGVHPTGRYQQVIETVRAIELPLEPLQAILEDDNRFLRYLLKNLAHRMPLSLHYRSDLPGAEQALIAYLRWVCPEHTITNVTAAAEHLNYSRRQLQRVLKDLTLRGVLIRSGKGRYTLAEP